MGDSEYRRYLTSPVDRIFYIVFGLIMVAAIAVVFALP
jgi:predicted benzoate:H+ symporter BenE